MAEYLSSSKNITVYLAANVFSFTRIFDSKVSFVGTSAICMSTALVNHSAFSSKWQIEVLNISLVVSVVP